MLTLQLSAQVKVDSLGFETFEMRSGDEVTVMKKYFVVLLKSGGNRSHDATTATEIQSGHMAHINWMAEQNFLHIAGPFADESEYRGIFILSVPSLEKAQELVNMDPAVKSGRLIADIHPWWSQIGAILR
jgi:uncharacterized protein